MSCNATDTHHCNRTFNALIGTALARLRHKDKWFDYEQAMVQGLSVRKATIGAKSPKTRAVNGVTVFCECLQFHQSNKMNGIVEADEMYFPRIQFRSATPNGGLV